MKLLRLFFIIFLFPQFVFADPIERDKSSPAQCQEVLWKIKRAQWAISSMNQEVLSYINCKKTQEFFIAQWKDSPDYPWCRSNFQESNSTYYQQRNCENIVKGIDLAEYFLSRCRAPISAMNDFNGELRTAIQMEKAAIAEYNSKQCDQAGLVKPIDPIIWLE